MLAFLVNFFMFSLSLEGVDEGILEESHVGDCHSFVGLFSKMFTVIWNGVYFSPGKAAYWTSLVWSRVRTTKDCRDELVLFGIYDYWWILVGILFRRRLNDAVFEHLIVGAFGILCISLCRYLRGGAAKQMRYRLGVVFGYRGGADKPLKSSFSSPYF